MEKLIFIRVKRVPQDWISATDRKEIRVNDLVTVFEDNVKRGSWKTAIVEKLIEGKDKVVRSA